MEDQGIFCSTDGPIPQNKLGINDASQLRRAEADFTALRIVQLQCSPVRGGFDSAHLQSIHRHLYQDLYDWAGELRADSSEIAHSLDGVLDRLRAEDLLRGSTPADWVERASGYIQQLSDQKPFPGDNGVALREFASELAGKNQLSLDWDQAFVVPQQEVQTANLRRLIMLAMDNDPSPHRLSHCDRQHLGREPTLEKGTY